MAHLSKKYYNTSNIKNLVANFVKYSIENKLDGIVCSPLEIKLVKKLAYGSLDIVTPGIRPENYNRKDCRIKFE